MDNQEFQDMLGRVKAGFKDRYGEGREDYRQAYYAAREMQEKDPEDARIKTTLATNPTFVTARDLMGISEPIYRGQREERGMGLSDDKATRVGQVLGTIGNDLTNDNSRGLWWLPMHHATADVVNEAVLAQANPDLFSHTQTGLGVPTMKDGAPKVYEKEELTAENRKKYEEAVAAGLISKEGVKRKGVGSKDGQFTKRKYDPGDVRALAIPTGIAINGGLGLLNFFGGSGGYEAVIPDADDPTKTANPILEVAAKYILGRTGNLLPYDEFSQVRPDVSREDYNRYKAFKYDKKEDWNPLDGDFTILGGALKGTSEGIHGPEVQMLGRSLQQQQHSLHI